MRFSIRAVFIIIALFAVLMTLIRFVEQAEHRSQVDSWMGQEKQWREACVEAIEAGQIKLASQYKDSEDYSAKNLMWHESQLRGFPTTLSTYYIIFIIIYAWSICLFMAARAERLENALRMNPTYQVRSNPTPFALWFGLGFIAPVAMMVLGFFFEEYQPHSGPKPWPATMIEGLLLVQLVHTILGVILLRGKRWLVLSLGIPSVVVAGWIGLHCHMSVTGVWL